MIADVATNFGELGCQPVSHDERADVVLARDVPVDRGRDIPSGVDAAPLSDEGVEILVGCIEKFYQVCRRTLCDAVGSFTCQIRVADGCRRPDQVRLMAEISHSFDSAYKLSKRTRITVGKRVPVTCPSERTITVANRRRPARSGTPYRCAAWAAVPPVGPLAVLRPPP